MTINRAVCKIPQTGDFAFAYRVPEEGLDSYRCKRATVRKFTFLLVASAASVYLYTELVQVVVIFIREAQK